MTEKKVNENKLIITDEIIRYGSILKYDIKKNILSVKGYVCKNILGEPQRPSKSTTNEDGSEIKKIWRAQIIIPNNEEITKALKAIVAAFLKTKDIKDIYITDYLGKKWQQILKSPIATLADYIEAATVGSATRNVLSSLPEVLECSETDYVISGKQFADKANGTPNERPTTALYIDKKKEIISVQEWEDAYPVGVMGAKAIMCANLAAYTIQGAFAGMSAYFHDITIINDTTRIRTVSRHKGDSADVDMLGDEEIVIEAYSKKNEDSISARAMANIDDDLIDEEDDLDEAPLE